MLFATVRCLCLLGLAGLLVSCGSTSYDYSLGDGYVLVHPPDTRPLLYYDDPQNGLTEPLLQASIRQACAAGPYVLVQVDEHVYVEGQRSEGYYLLDKRRRKGGVRGPFSHRTFQQAVHQAGVSDCLHSLR